MFMNQPEIAIQKISLIENDARYDQRKKAEAKLLLGDINLMQAKTGDAMLLYMNVERMIEDDDLGHVAKFKTAKSMYFDSEFELAQAQLEILKNATTRKIANDAMDLSLLIKGNYDLDTTPEPMIWYANTEFLILQNKYDEAMSLLDDLMKKYPNHSLTEEVYYQKAQIYQKTNRYTEAVAELKKVSDIKDCILADDAANELAQIYDYKLQDKVQAKEFYKKILIDFPGSIYVAEARKRFYEI
jgi:TolA-binding protein